MAGRAYLRKVCQVHWGNIVRWHVWRSYPRGVTVVGQENIPANGPALVCSNHPGYAWDPCYVTFFGPRTRWGDYFYWTDAGIFVDAPFRTLYLKAIGCIPVERFEDPNEREKGKEVLFQSTIEALDQNGLVVVFPEGRGYAAPPLQPLRNGFARVAQAWAAQRPTDLPIIPCAMNQVEGAGMVIQFGKPLFFDRSFPDASGALSDLMERLECALRSMCIESDFTLEIQGV
jgi:1-acyl-sn-glycerol-3-phosphate acyltransferase